VQWEREEVLVRAHASNFPTLNQIARKVLCIPATSAPAERVFSTAGLTISTLRAKLDCENASCLTFLRDNWELSAELKKAFEVEIL
jgi:hAT family C-terminal dimerisation region